jgi:cytochrome c oxidase subunit IV
MREHIVSPKIYYAIFIALVVLTVVTWSIAKLDLGRMNAVVAMTIAVIKATLVVLYFMHVRYSSRLTWVFVGAGFFWLAMMVALTMSDYMTRGWLTIAQ